MEPRPIQIGLQTDPNSQASPSKPPYPFWIGTYIFGVGTYVFGIGVYVGTCRFSIGVYIGACLFRIGAYIGTYAKSIRGLP